MSLQEREHILQAPDGWRLHVVEVCPPEAKDTVVAGHAMMVDRRTLWRRPSGPSLVRSLARRGYRVLVPDLRGHGRSGPAPREGGLWSYADLVADTALYVELAQRLGGKAPILLGHSLFGHTSLAYLGQRPHHARALVLVAVNVWSKRWTPQRRRWWRKRAVMGGATALARLMGYMPTRRVGFGSADEALPYWNDVARVVSTGRWEGPALGATHRVSYAAGLAQVALPVLAVVSEGDRLFAHPEDALSFTAELPQRDVLRVGSAQAPTPLRALRADHMSLVTSARSEPVWDAIGDWLERTVAR